MKSGNEKTNANDSIRALINFQEKAIEEKDKFLLGLFTDMLIDWFSNQALNDQDTNLFELFEYEQDQDKSQAHKIVELQLEIIRLKSSIYDILHKYEAV